MQAKFDGLSKLIKHAEFDNLKDKLDKLDEFDEMGK